MHLYHDSKLGGHFRFKKTYDKMVKEVWWPGMSRDVTKYLKNCEVCERSIQGTTGCEPLKPIIETEVGRTINVDLIELDRTHKGNKYGLVAVWAKTKYPHCIPIPDKSALTVARALYHNIFSQFGIPKRLQMDQGTEFKNQVLNKLREVLEIKGVFSTAYHPQTNELIKTDHNTQRIRQLLKLPLAVV